MSSITGGAEEGASTTEKRSGGDGGGALRSLFWLLTNRGDRNRMGYVRLRGDYRTFREEFDAQVARAEAAGVEDFSWREDAQDLFDRIDTALERGRVSDGWRHFHGARRIEVYGLEAIDAADDDAKEVESRARALRTEALSVLGGWRKAAVEDLLGAEQLRDDVTSADVRQAHVVLNEQYENVNLRRDYAQMQFKQLFRLGLVSSLLFLFLSAMPYFLDPSVPYLGPLAAFLEPPFTIATGSGAEPTVTSLGFAVFVGLTGIIGSSLFGMLALRKEEYSVGVAQQLTGFTITWARGLFGAIGAVFFYFLLQTPFVAVGENTAAVMIVVGFAAGYSERMVTRALRTVSSTSK